MLILSLRTEYISEPALVDDFARAIRMARFLGVTVDIEIREGKRGMKMSVDGLDTPSTALKRCRNLFFEDFL